MTRQIEGQPVAYWQMQHQRHGQVPCSWCRGHGGCEDCGGRGWIEAKEAG